VREPGSESRPKNEAAPITLADARRLELSYWLIVVLGAVFTLARFSEAFLVLRAQNVGLELGFVPLVLIAMNVFYAAAAYPAGVAADRVSRWTLLLLGLAMLVIADLVLAMAATPWQVFAGAALWGLHMGFTQGLLSKLVADNAPAILRGTAFGIFNLVSGVAMLLASVVAGALWELVGPSATFIAGAAFAAIAALGILGYRRRPGAA
jgi:MFS family permease